MAVLQSNGVENFSMIARHVELTSEYHIFMQTTEWGGGGVKSKYVQACDILITDQ